MKWRHPPQDVIAISFAIAAVLYLFYACAHIVTTLAPDFSVLYFATKNLLHHANPYSNKNLYTFFAYPPVTTLLYIPFTFLPYVIAQCMFTLLSMLSIAGSVYISMRLIRGKIAVNFFLVAFALTVFSFPTKFTLGMGQSNLIALWALLVGFWYNDRKEGVCVAFTVLAVILKPVLIFMLLFYALRKNYRILFSVAAVGLICVALSVIVYGIQPYAYYIHHVIPQLMETGGREVYFNQGTLGFISRIVEDPTIRKLLSTTIAVALVGIISFLFRKKISDNDLFSLLFTALVLVDTLSWQHHFVFLIFPFIHYYVHYYDSEDNTAVAILFYLTYILVALNVRIPSRVTGPAAALILSHQFTGAVILYGLLYIRIWNKHTRE